MSEPTDITDAADETPEVSSESAIERALPDSDTLAPVVAAFDDVTFEVRSYASSEATYVALDVPVSDWVAFATAAKEAGFDLFVDIAAVDHFRDGPRFEVALNLVSMSANERIIASTRVPYDDPVVPSLTGVFAGANFYEREAFDLLGIEFPGHPDLTRILLPDDWEGHPLRKDFDIGAVPVEFKAGSSDL